MSLKWLQELKLQRVEGSVATWATLWVEEMVGFGALVSGRMGINQGSGILKRESALREPDVIGI